MRHAFGTTPVIGLAPATQTALYNVFTAAGSPVAPVNVVVTIGAGVVLQAGLDTGALPAGSILMIVNKGTIAGRGGAGAPGGEANAVLGAGGNGNAGDPAIVLRLDTNIDNTSGAIYGGGGGGAGGGAAALSNPPAGGPAAPGGGGGGGRGYNGASGGVAGATNGNGTAASAGSAGSSGAAGGGGTHGSSSFAGNGGDGGLGGDWGTAGNSGAAASPAGGASASGAGTGGAAGNAVTLNGHAVSWLGGFNITQVKGAVA